MISLRLMKTTPFMIKRLLNNGVYDNDGFSQKDITEELEGLGNFQPLTGKELLQLEEGDRLRESFNLFTQTVLTVNDIVVRNNVEYKVRSVEDWFQQNLAHNVGIIVRKDV